MFKLFIALLAAYVIGNLINSLVGYAFTKAAKKILISDLKKEITDELANHKKLIDQLYADRDEDVNKIADQINRLDEIVSEKDENKNK